VLPLPVISTLHSPQFAPFSVLGTVCLSHSLFSLFHSLPRPSSPRFLRVLCVSALNPLSSISAFDFRSTCPHPVGKIPSGSGLSTLAHSSATKHKRPSFLFYHLRTLLLFRGRGVSLTSPHSLLNSFVSSRLRTLLHPSIPQLLCNQRIAHSEPRFAPTLRSQCLCVSVPHGLSTINFQPSLSPSPLQCPATIKPEGK
jgi:hypothetical protein